MGETVDVIRAVIVTLAVVDEDDVHLKLCFGAGRSSRAMFPFFHAIAVF